MYFSFTETPTAKSKPTRKSVASVSPKGRAKGKIQSPAPVTPSGGAGKVKAKPATTPKEGAKPAGKGKGTPKVIVTSRIICIE